MSVWAVLELILSLLSCSLLPALIWWLRLKEINPSLLLLNQTRAELDPLQITDQSGSYH